MAALTPSIIHLDDHAARRLRQSLIVGLGVKRRPSGGVKHAISRGNTVAAEAGAALSFRVDVGICR